MKKNNIFVLKKLLHKLKPMKNILFLFLFILFSCEAKSQQNSKANNDLPNYRISHVKNYIKGKDYNQDIAIFINFRIPSNRLDFSFMILKIIRF